MELVKLLKFWRKPNKVNTQSIEIDLTYECNLKCNSCNRSCGFAPAKDMITVSQIEKFIKESIQNKIYWKHIRLLGGEPTLHPNLLQIIELLKKEYVDKFSKDTHLELTTNGLGERVNEMLPKIPKYVQVHNTNKQNNEYPMRPFNDAPVDTWYFNLGLIDYRNGCWVMNRCGMGMTPYGFYPCAVAGGIDRVFGGDIGRKSLPKIGDSMDDILDKYCRYCGQFQHVKRDKTKSIISKTWKKMYKKYNKDKPELTRY